MAKNISFTIKFWRQNGPKDQGHFDTHEMHDIPDDTSFLEMLKARSHSYSITTAARVSAVCAHSTSMVHLTVLQSVVLPHVSSTCAVSMMVMLSPLSLGAQLPSL